MNPMNGIRGKNFIHKMLPTALICQSKALKVLMQSDMPFGLSRQQSTKFVPLCRLNYQSHGIEFVSDFLSSLTIFGNIWRIKLLLQKLCHWNLNFRAEMDGNFCCKMD